VPKFVADSSTATGLAYAAPAAGGGLVHINTTTFSAVASQSVNDVFSATYKNYKIFFNLIASGNADIRMLLRSSGTDAITNYNRQLINANVSTVSTAQATSQTNGFFIGFANASHNSGAEIIIMNAFESISTQINSQYLRSDGPQFAANTGLHTTAASYDGFTISPASGTITGEISIYGLVN
jgi:hypothetical protein